MGSEELPTHPAYDTSEADDSNPQYYIEAARELLDDNNYEAAIQKLKTGLEPTGILTHRGY